VVKRDFNYDKDKISNMSMFLTFLLDKLNVVALNNSKSDVYSKYYDINSALFNYYIKIRHKRWNTILKKD
jgi:hypothetical protein